MSDVQKRGRAGASNAAASPFRLNGRSPDWQARQMGCYAVGPSSGPTSRSMRGLYGGLLLHLAGFEAGSVAEKMAGESCYNTRSPRIWQAIEELL